MSYLLYLYPRISEKRISIANALELCLSCTDPSILSDADGFMWPRNAYTSGMVEPLALG